MSRASEHATRRTTPDHVDWTRHRTAIMRKWLRRIRGAVGIGLTWGAAWAGAGVMLAVATGFQADVPFPLFFGLLGFCAGVIFSAFLALSAGQRRFDQMSLPRFAAWGAAGGLLLSAVFAKAASLDWGDVLGLAPTFALASAVCASGSLAVARRAVSRALPDIQRNTAEDASAGALARVLRQQREEDDADQH